MKRKLTLILCLLLAACGSPEQPAAGAPQAWFDMPLPDTIFFPPNPCQVVAHGASVNGVALFEFSINGAVTASIPSPEGQETLATFHYPCSLLQPGRNLLEVRASDAAGNWSDYAETTVILAGARRNDPTSTATLVPSDILTVFTPSATSTPTVTRSGTRTPFTPLPTWTLANPTARPTDIPTDRPTETIIAGPVCSIYTDERTCIANGCNWVLIPGTVPIYECRNP